MPTKPKLPRASSKQGTGFTLIDAPWRYKYFDAPKTRDCFICRAIASDPRRDAQNLLLVRRDHAVIMLNRYPYTMGALMVAPIVHAGDFRSLDEETLLEMDRLVKYSLNILDKAVHPGGFNIGINQGEAAGAGLQDHLHTHVVPRWEADTNFMTTIGGARVLAEDVDSMYRRLRKAIRNGA